MKIHSPRITAFALLLSCAPFFRTNAQVQVFPFDFAGFSAATNAPVALNFDTFPANTTITGKTFAGMTLRAPGSPLIVVKASQTGSDSSVNKLIPSSGAMVLSPGGSELASGPNAGLENDDLSITFVRPVSSFGCDILFQSQDFFTAVNVTVFNAADEVLFSGAVETNSSAGGGAPAGNQFWGVVSSERNIKRIEFDEYDDNDVFPDSNIGYDTFRVGPALTPIVTLSASRTSITEDPQRSTVITVSANKVVNSDLVVNFRLSGSATLGSDYTASKTRQITIKQGLQSTQFSLKALTDGQVEPAENIKVTLRPGANYQIAKSGLLGISIPANDN